MIRWRRLRLLTVSLSLVAACPCNGGSSGGGTASSGAPASSGSTGAATTEGNDRVTITNGPTPSVVALDGKGKTTCYFGTLFEGSGTIDLLDRLESPSDCSSEVVAFARDRAVQLEAAPAWSHDATRPVELTMEPMVVVPIHFYVPQGTGLDGDAKDEMDLANGLYAANRAGIMFQMSGVASYTGSPVATNCTNVSALVSATGMYDPEVVNVYYVPQINGNVSLGYNCYPESIVINGVTVAAENIIFLSNARASTTLAHELGHTLGLRNAVEHTSVSDGFTIKNLLMGVLTWEEQDAQNHLSLGQVYRMSLDELSWLNHARPTGTAGIRKGGTRKCQDSKQAVKGDPCPKLALDL